jgi:hypothetical protein
MVGMASNASSVDVPVLFSMLLSLGLWASSTGFWQFRDPAGFVWRKPNFGSALIPIILNFQNLSIVMRSSLFLSKI